MEISLVCPICKKVHQNYKDFFACWTGHLNQKLSDSKESMPLDHDDAIIFIKDNPQCFERGIRILASEVGVFHGCIDLIGVDVNRNLVLIDVDNGHDLGRKARQLKRYRESIRWMGTHIFGLRLADIPDIRLIIVNPGKEIREIK